MKRPEFRPTLTIILKRPLQDYIRYVMSLEQPIDNDQILLASKCSYLGRLVTPFLEYRPTSELPLLPDRGPDHFTFGLTRFTEFIQPRNNTVWISYENQVNIQHIVEYHFKLHFRMYADDKLRYFKYKRVKRNTIKNLINSFCVDVNMKFDTITFDMVAQSYYRSRKKIGKKGFELDNKFVSRNMMMLDLFTNLPQ